jgi:hypothetical protein
MQAITGLNETISLVLDFLQDAKVHILINEICMLVFYKIIHDEDENVTGSWATER